MELGFANLVYARGGYMYQEDGDENFFTGASAGAGVNLNLGGTGLKGWVGTTGEGVPLDVPHLVGAYETPPYLHDARAKTLEEVFGKHNRAQRHGGAHRLSEEELADVLRYVREL